MTANSREQIPPLLVLGVGNVLMKDEGVGCHVARKLQKDTLPSHVEVIDGGTMGLELLWHLEGREKVIVIDVVQAGEPPGTLFRFKPGDIRPASDPKSLSFHQLGFFDILKVAQYIDTQLPEMIMIAVQPEDISMGETFSPVIEAKIPEIIKLVREQFGDSE